jgi:predicted TIM-barrel fold metal-dependent hydrolase
VGGEILHTRLGFRLFWLHDAKLQQECFRVYNEWLSEFCSYDPQRLVGVAFMSLYDIDSSPIYDPLWATAQELEMPVVLHEITGGAESRLINFYWEEHRSLDPVIAPHEIQRTLGMMVLSGVFEQFPPLKVISAENHADWLPSFLRRLKKAFRDSPSSYATKLSMDAVDYFHRQVYVTYMNEPEAIEGREIICMDNLVFATDYPHGVSTLPNSQDVVDRDFAALPDGERRKMIHDNIVQAYGLAPVRA